MLCARAAPSTTAQRSSSASIDDGQLGPLISAAAPLLGPSATSHGALQALQSAYSQREQVPLWSRDRLPTPQADALLRALHDAEAYGLQSPDYVGNGTAGSGELQAPSLPASDLLWMQFDVRLSAAALRFLSDLHFGRVSPEAAGFQLRAQHGPFDLAGALHQLATAPDIGPALHAVEPSFYHYALLKEALARYRNAMRLPDPTQLPPAPTALKVGDSYAGAPTLRSFLGALGDLPPGTDAASADLTFDAELSAGVRNFQRRHGLAQDGMLGKTTLASLKTPP